MKQEVKIGQTDYSTLVWIGNSASTTGAGKTGLTSASIAISYVRMETDNDAVLADGIPVDLAFSTSAHSDWGLYEMSTSKTPGLYRLDYADGVFASGAWSAVVYIRDAASNGVLATPMEFILVPDAPITGVNVSQWNGAAVATPTVAGVPEVDVTYFLGTAASTPATVSDMWSHVMTDLSAPPIAASSASHALSWIYMMARNKVTQTATTQAVFADNGTTTAGTSTLSDNGTTATRGEFA